MDIPVDLQAHLEGLPFTLDTVGKSGARILCFADKVLKIQPEGPQAAREVDMLSWLAGKCPVPKVLYAKAQDGRHYLLMTRAPGEMACTQSFLNRPALLTRLLARGLRTLWGVDISHCPYRNALEQKLDLAALRVAKQLCDMQDAQPGTYGPGGFSSPAALLKWLRANKPPESPVFSHGDFCLPNIFLTQQGVGGFIDLGNSGVADAYQDIALCYRSLRDNLTGKYSAGPRAYWRPALLFDALGLAPDWARIRYYILLDELL